MIFGTTGWAFAIAFCVALLITALELGHLLIAHTGVAWIDAAIVLSVVAICAVNLLKLARTAIIPNKHSCPYQLIASGSGYAAFVYIIHQHPIVWEIPNWTWTYPDLEMSQAFNDFTLFGPSLYTLWELSFYMIFVGAAVTFFALYIALAEAVGIVMPRAWAYRNQIDIEASLRTQVSALTLRVDELSHRNEKLVHANTVLGGEVERLKSVQDGNVPDKKQPLTLSKPMRARKK